MKKKLTIFFIGLLLLVLHLVLPLLEFRFENKIIYFTYEESFGEFEDNMCYNESISYNAKRNISVNNWDIKDVHFGFYMITLSFEKGNLCDYEYILEESYINNFLENAVIEYNEQNIDLSSLIEGKEAIVGNTKYYSEDSKISIDYILDGEYETLFIFYVDDLLVIQVGLSDEGPRFIAYR